jgi:hypothetical protein
MLKKLYTILFFTGLFFFSFNEFEGIPLLGEFQNEAGAFFFLSGFVVLLLDGRFYLPVKNKIYFVLLLFLFWCAVATLINLPGVMDSYFKHTPGLSRFVRQYFSLLLSTVVFFMLYWNVIREMSYKDIFYRIRKVFFISMIVASAYGFFETLFSIFHIAAAYPILQLFSYFPFLEVKVHEIRISSIAYEPPFLAIYLITVAGWMFSYILTEKKWYRFIPAIAVLILTFYSGSRTALLVVFIQLAVFLHFLYKSEQYRIYLAYMALGVMLLSVGLLAINAAKVIRSVETKLDSLNFQDNLTKNVSNQSRFGMQYAALKVFEEHPVAGVGFGQQTYHSRYHYPGWATKDNYEFTLFYKNPNEKAFPPAYNLYTRLLAETGIVGTGIFLWLIYLVISGSRRLIRKFEGEEKIIALILLISFTGFAINWLQIDTFRMYGFWLCLAILIKLGNAKTASANE